MKHILQPAREGRLNGPEGRAGTEEGLWYQGRRSMQPRSWMGRCVADMRRALEGDKDVTRGTELVTACWKA